MRRSNHETWLARRLLEAAEAAAEHGGGDERSRRAFLLGYLTGTAQLTDDEQARFDALLDRGEHLAAVPSRSAS